MGGGSETWGQIPQSLSYYRSGKEKKRKNFLGRVFFLKVAGRETVFLKVLFLYSALYFKDVFFSTLDI